MSRHLVHFYDGAYPAEEASDFIVAGLLAGDTCIVMLTEVHRRAVESRLEPHRMFSTPARQHTGHYLVLDTDETLSRLTVNGRLDTTRATESLGALLNPASHGGQGRVRLVGDPAAALFASGNEEDSLALEALVGRLATEQRASVFCAYAMQDIHRCGSTHSLIKLCAEHHAIQLPRQAWIQGFVEAAQRVSEKQG